MAIDTEKLKKIFPSLRNVDFDDPAQRRKVALKFIGIALLLIVGLVCIIINNSKSRAPKRDLVAVEETETSSAPSNPAENIELLDVPTGADNDDVLQSDNMMAAREKRRGTRAHGVSDEWDNAEAQDDDILGSMGGRQDQRNTRNTEMDERMARLDAGVPGQSPQPGQTAQPSGSKQRTGAMKKGGMVAGSPEARARQERAAQSSQHNPTAQEREATDPVTVTVRRSGAISSLDDSYTDENISSLDHDSQYISEDAGHPFKVMFAKEEKVASGQRVTLRLLEDMVAGSVLIPKNTHFSATVSISDRIQIRVSSIELNGKIIPMNYSAYDNDGTRGLYCPASEVGRAAEDIAQSELSMATSSLRSVLSGAGGRAIGNAISSGARVVGRGSNSKVVVSPGYTFYIIKD